MKILLLILTCAAAQPNLELYTIFSADITAYQWQDETLTPFHGLSGRLLVDSPGNRVMIHAELQMPPFGKAHVDTVIYISEGISFTYVDALDVCHVEHLQS